MGKRVAIIECFNNSSSAKSGNTTIAHIKNNKIIANYIGCEYLIDKYDLIYGSEMEWDVLLFTNSSAFAEHELIKEIIKRNPKARKIFISNDYHTTPPSDLTKSEYEIIANYIPKKKNNLTNSYFLNLNSLMALPPNKIIEKKYDCIYWGACRDDRADYFKEYLQNGIYLSTTNKAKKKFLELNCKPTYLPPIDWKRPIVDLFRYSIYIEDKYIHNNFHNLANRWYEAGEHNLVMFFDKNCINTINKSEISDVFDDYYIVGSHEELSKKIKECNKNYQKHAEIQRKWHERDLLVKNQVLKEIKDIIEK